MRWEEDHRDNSKIQVKNEWSYTSTPPTCLHGVMLSYLLRECQYSKVKIKSLCFSRAPSTAPRRRIGGLDVQLDAFLTSALDGDEWSASTPGRFTPRERASGTRWIGGWVGLRAGLDAVVKIKIPTPAGTRTTDYPVRRPTLYS
jgi:hypothetical protein